MTPPWPGRIEPRSLIPRSRLMADSARSPTTAATPAAAPVIRPCQTWPCSSRGTVTAPAIRHSRTEPARPSQVLLGLMALGHRVPAQRAAGEVAADVHADDQDHEDQHPAGAIRRGQHGHHEQRRERQVGEQEDTRGDVAQVTVGTPGQAPGQNDHHGQDQGRQHRAVGPPVFAQPHGGAGRGDGDQRHVDAVGPEGPGHFPQADADSHGHEDEEGRLDREQRRDDQAAEQHADRRRDREVASRGSGLGYLGVGCLGRSGTARCRAVRGG